MVLFKVISEVFRLSASLRQYVTSMFQCAWEGSLAEIVNVHEVPHGLLTMWANSEGSVETVQMTILAWTFAVRICNKGCFLAVMSTHNVYPLLDRSHYNKYAEPKIRERLYLSRNLVLHLRNCSRFWEQRSAISSLECPTSNLHVFLHVEVTPNTNIDSISFICFR